MLSFRTRLEYWFGNMLALMFITGMFFALYKFLPSRRIRWQPALVGADGEDSDLGGNPSATPASARAPSAPSSATGATACADCTKPAEGLEFVDGPGAHAPTAAQRDPAKTVWLKR